MQTWSYRVSNVDIRSPFLTAQPTKLTPARAGPDHQGLPPPPTSPLGCLIKHRPEQDKRERRKITGGEKTVLFFKQ